jgi:hypothetical protein
VSRKTRDGQVVHRRVIDHLPDSSPYQRFNKWLALRVTQSVGTMTCAYIFAAFDCLALPTALHQGLYGIVQWAASFFLQLVLLSVIMVGQNLQAVASDARSSKTFDDTEVIIDRLDSTTQGGITEVLDRLDALESKVDGLSRSKGR